MLLITNDNFKDAAFTVALVPLNFTNVLAARFLGDASELAVLVQARKILPIGG